jgi:hypothetical protein
MLILPVTPNSNVRERRVEVDFGTFANTAALEAAIGPVVINADSHTYQADLSALPYAKHLTNNKLALRLSTPAKSGAAVHSGSYTELRFRASPVFATHLAALDLAAGDEIEVSVSVNYEIDSYPGADASGYVHSGIYYSQADDWANRASGMGFTDFTNAYWTPTFPSQQYDYWLTTFVWYESLTVLSFKIQVTPELLSQGYIQPGLVFVKAWAENKVNMHIGKFIFTARRLV